MSTPAFEIVGGWLRIQGHRIRMSTISRYSLYRDNSCSIYQQDAPQGATFNVDGLAEYLDAWFEAEAMDTYQREGGTP